MKKKQVQYQEDSTYRIFPIYRRKCDGMGISPLPIIKQLLQMATNANKLQTIQSVEDIGPIQIRAFMQALVQVKYEKLKVLKLWKANVFDEGVRSICQYLNFDKNGLQILDLMENQITQLGCEFIGKSLSADFSKLKHLKLDNNLIGTEGLKNLTYGLRSHTNLLKLSMKYCGMDQKSVRYIQQILANIHTKIRSIKLQGNIIGNQGIYQILRVVDANQSLQKLNIADTGLNLLNFKAKIMRIIQKDQNQQSQNDDDLQENPEKTKENNGKSQELKSIEKSKKNEPNLQNIKQVVPLQKQKHKKQGTSRTNKLSDRSSNKNKFGQIVQKKQRKRGRSDEEEQVEKQNIKIIRTLNENDHTSENNIIRLLLSIMRNNKIMKKYDFRYNPISDDAAFMIFEVIQDNIMIKDVEFNNNVDYELRQNLDTLMRKRTGRMPKGRGRGRGRGKGKKKGKK